MKTFVVQIINFFNFFHNFVELKRKKVAVGKNFVIHGKIHIHGKGAVRLGDNCIVTSSANYNPTSGDSNTHFHTMNSGKLFIGNNVGISNSSITAEVNVTIEDNVLIGSGCIISDTDHHSILYSDRMDGDSNVATGSILIKEGAFIGTRAIILKGVTIGEHSIIGAGSVIAKDIPDNEIWAGNPARFIKKII